MQFIKVPVTTLETLIEGLENAVNVCTNVDETAGKSERTYPYAVGYSKGVMDTILWELNCLKSQAK